MSALRAQARGRGYMGTGPVNVGRGGKVDYRIPDATVHAARSTEICLPSALLVAEVYSPDDDSYAKSSSYHALGVSEIVVVRPERSGLELYRRRRVGYEEAAGSGVLGIGREDLERQIDW